jgi:hypothetical protein
MMPNVERRRVVIILANLMDQDGTLNAETIARLELGCEIAKAHTANEVLLMGWDYREDSNLPISVAMQVHMERHELCPEIKSRCNIHSRDTVGDAILSAVEYWPDLAGIDPIVVTSDYHAERSGKIFSFVWGRDIPVHGAVTASGGEERAARDTAESASLYAFDRTFEGIAPGDVPGCCVRLLTDHPFYNGSAMPVRPFDQAALGRALAAHRDG